MAPGSAQHAWYYLLNYLKVSSIGINAGPIVNGLKHDSYVMIVPNPAHFDPAHSSSPGSGFFFNCNPDMKKLTQH